METKYLPDAEYATSVADSKAQGIAYDIPQSGGRLVISPKDDVQYVLEKLKDSAAMASKNA